MRLRSRIFLGRPPSSCHIWLLGNLIRQSGGEMPHYYHQSGLEPPLDEVLADPIVHLILRRDRIDVGILLQYVDEARSRLQRDADNITPRRGAASHGDLQQS
jgi:hypothetical protein